MRNESPTHHAELLAWVDEIAQLCQPKSVVWCDGSAAENDRLIEEMLASGALFRLNEKKRPGSYLCRSDPRDVARVESRTLATSGGKV